MEKHPYKNKEWLEKAIEDYGTVNKISRELKQPKTSLYRYIRYFGLQDKIKHPAQNHLYSFNDSFFEKIDTEEKAYWLGMLVADGNISDFGRKSYTIRLLLKESDIYHVQKFADALELKKQVRIDKEGRGSIAIHSKKMFFDLMNHGVTPNKTGYEIFPDLDDPLMPHFIRGFFDGDGTIYERNQNGSRKRSMCAIGFVCMNKKFMDDLLLHLEKTCNVSIKNHYKESKNVYECKTEAINSCVRIINYIYENATIYLNRKYEKARNFLNKLPDSGRIPRKQ